MLEGDFEVGIADERTSPIEPDNMLSQMFFFWLRPKELQNLDMTNEACGYAQSSLVS